MGHYIRAPPFENQTGDSGHLPLYGGVIRVGDESQRISPWSFCLFMSTLGSA